MHRTTRAVAVVAATVLTGVGVATATAVPAAAQIRCHAVRADGSKVCPPHLSAIDHPVRLWKVRPGDDLWHIAAVMYHNGHRWHTISAANALDSTVIYPGQVLVVPLPGSLVDAR